MADGALREKLASCGIVARINPRQKQRIIRVLQESGEVVSYTGKGAGDVLPLQAADVGVVTKTCPTPALRHASSLVVSGFSAFLSAMEEVKELFSQRESMGLYQWCGSGLLALLVISGLLLGLGLPLLPLQMIWLGLVGIGLQVPNFAACSWREVLPQGKRSLDRGSALWKRFQSLALVLGAGVGVTLLAFWWTAEDSMVARTAAFNTMAMVQLFTGFYVITQGKRQDMGQGPLVTSPAGFVSFLAFPLAQLAITIVPFLQVMFHTTALAWGEWILVLVLGCAPFLFLWGIQWIKATVMHKIMYLRV